MVCFAGLPIGKRVAAGCLLSILLASTAVFCQDNMTGQAQQVPSVGTNLAPLPDSAFVPPPVEGQPGKSVDPFIAREKVKEALLKEDFSYNQSKLVDPFISFIAPVEATTPKLLVSEEDFEPPPNRSDPSHRFRK